ncbi:hypothetical protein DL769_000345 [Monosporascus sp. CRB-8-3]|nr:hypothetical protein DL769_000345 [Monosporascus sp. CRB-8-3]
MVRGKHFINGIDDLTGRLLLALLANDESLRLIPETKVPYRRPPAQERKVIIISAGGSGHEPAHAGYVGHRMLDVAVAGNILASSSAPQILSAIQAIEAPLGALLVVKNYTGDKLNFGLAAEKAKAQGRQIQVVLVDDDVSIMGNVLVGRRGLAGVVFVHKIAGAAASSGCNMPQREEQERLAADVVEYSMDIHNEPGAETCRVMSIQDTGAKLIDILLPGGVQGSRFQGGAVAVMINNLGGLSLLELQVIADEILQQLSDRVVAISRVFIGTPVTALDGPGVSVTLLKLDDELQTFLDAPTAVNAWPKTSAA